jgi:hypothetical protein
MITCYHELDGVRTTSENADDMHHRSINEFLAEVNQEAQRGWRAFDPYDSEGSFGHFLTSRSLGTVNFPADVGHPADLRHYSFPPSLAIFAISQSYCQSRLMFPAEHLFNSRRRSCLTADG